MVLAEGLEFEGMFRLKVEFGLGLMLIRGGTRGRIGVENQSVGLRLRVRINDQWLGRRR